MDACKIGTTIAIRYAAQGIDDTIVVFNGDVMTDVDLPAVLAKHRDAQARATIVLTPVDNPTAYGLVETSADGHVTRFLEKPAAHEITCNTINAGIYVLEPQTFDRIPKDTNYSIERAYFPSLVERGETFVAHIERGYWIDIGTPEKYLQVHRDMFDGRFAGGLFRTADRTVPMVSPDARIDAGAMLEGPCFVDAGAHIKPGATIGAYAVVGRGCVVEEGARVTGAILWPNTRVGEGATIDGSLIGRGCHVGRFARVGPTAILGDKTSLTDYTQA